jgi:hypothetical protein
MHELRAKNNRQQEQIGELNARLLDLRFLEDHCTTLSEENATLKAKVQALQQSGDVGEREIPTKR